MSTKEKSAVLCCAYGVGALLFISGTRKLDFHMLVRDLPYPHPGPLYVKLHGQRSSLQVPAVSTQPVYRIVRVHDGEGRRDRKDVVVL